MWEIIILQPDEDRLRCHTLRRASNYYIQYFTENTLVLCRNDAAVSGTDVSSALRQASSHTKNNEVITCKQPFSLKITLLYVPCGTRTGIFRRQLAQEYTEKLTT